MDSVGICMPTEYGGSQLGISEAAVMMQTISESGAGMAGASSVYINIFDLEPVAKFGNAEQKRRFLIPLVQGRERACFGVTEPNTGLDTLKLRSMAMRNGEHYILKGSKIWISAAQHAEKDLNPRPDHSIGQSYKTITGPLALLHGPRSVAVDSNTLFFENWKVPAADMIGEENNGFKMIIHGMNAERILIAAEALGLGYAALRRAAKYANERQAARMYDAGYTSGEYANAAKYLAAEAVFRACDRAVMSHGGMGYAREYHVERYLREAFIPRIAPMQGVHGAILDLAKGKPRYFV
ncbi:predicted protein [Histoplasma mississippiense (nom. inval.)]|uniref:predicted protein n=1 Tax=Ajellomyces capsulatus (strain NAm1 / WU24) TaxID=2059318 RepID=UPI000157D377|nr:predicted protein [Histoplasma mississippiense (nom. inval.)]EDN04672.1 predicted protein [Histoplasma mississippiense (nom. inval.)]